MELGFYLQRLSKMFETYKVEESSVDYSQLDIHISFLKQLAILENSSLAVFDMCKKGYAFTQVRNLDILGFDEEEMKEKGPSLFYSKIHPQDIPILIEAYELYSDFLDRLPFEEKKDFKLMADFRIRDKNDKYIRCINQMVPLHLNKAGDIWLMLIMYDYLASEILDMRGQRKLLNIKTNELYYFPKDSGDDTINKLTKREIEILGLLAKGMASKKIADELFISVNTVNNHRRNILEKTQSENTAMAIQYGLSIGVL